MKKQKAVTVNNQVVNEYLVVCEMWGGREKIHCCKKFHFSSNPADHL